MNKVREIGFYLCLFLLGMLFYEYVVLPHHVNRWEKRIVSLEDSVSKLNTQGYIAKSLETQKLIKK